MTSGRRQLEELAQTGNYVFHGSSVVVEKLEPRQAYDYSTGERREDFRPAVFATDYLEVAIFMALYDAAPGPKSGNFGTNGKTLTLGVTKGAFDNQDLTSHVYVFKKSDFQLLRGIEYVSEKEVVPVKVVEVGLSDLHHEVETIPHHGH